MASKAPAEPSSKHLQLLKPGFIVNVANYDNDPASRQAIDNYGGLEKYKADVDAYYRAYDKYRVDWAEWNYQQMTSGALPGYSQSAAEGGLANAYNTYAEKTDDPEEKKRYQDAADIRAKASEDAKAVEDRNKTLRAAAEPIRDQLRKENLALRDATFTDLITQRDAALAEVDTSYDADLSKLRALKDSGMIGEEQYTSARDQIAARRADARKTVYDTYEANRTTATDRYNQGKTFYSDTYNSIMGGDYEEGRQYALPTYDKELIQISSTYKPRFGDIPEDSKPAQFYGEPGQQPSTGIKYIKAEGLRNPSGTGGGGQGGGSGGSSIVGGTPVVGDQSGSLKLLDASNLQQTPGLISSADMLTYTPAANLNTGGLIYGQNPQLYNYGSARVRMPGSM